MSAVSRAAALALCCIALACSPRPERGEAHKALRAFVTIPPQAFFVKEIAGDRVHVDVLIPPGQSPHAFEPTPLQVTKLAEADVYFAIGEAFEQALIPKLIAVSPRLRVVDTREGVPLRTADNLGGEDAHGTVMDPHIWLAPRLVKIQAATIARTLEELDPEGGSLYRQNLQAFNAALDAEDGKLARTLADVRGEAFFVYHPSFGYFADAYGLRQVPIEIAGKEPSAKEMAALIDRAKADGIRVILVAPQFSEKSARAIAASIGGTVVRVDPYAVDYFHDLDAIARAIHDAARSEKP